MPGVKRGERSIRGCRPPVGSKQLLHVESCVVPSIAMLLANRTGDASKAAALPAVIDRCRQMIEAGSEIVAFGIKRADRAGRQARAILTVIAGMTQGRLGITLRRVVAVDQECGAEGEPKAVSRVDGEPDR